ncbi:DUF3224 domain-containing protein [Nocardia sp. NPDC057030]|uniref:DUF3224 domain-containing protein n=1 Tax=unclassified Nocardia TaxID=2637762 RepID=UPI003627A34D
MTIARGTIQAETWNQTPFSQIDDTVALTTISGTDRYVGDIEGTASMSGVTFGGAEDSGVFYSLQRMECVISGRKGTFVVLLTGTFDPSSYGAEARVIPNSGTGELKGISGTGRLEPSSDGYTYTLDYTI